MPAHHASLAQLEGRVRDDLASAGELAGDGRRRAIRAGDGVLHRGLDVGGGAVLEHAAVYVLAAPDARRGSFRREQYQCDASGPDWMRSPVVAGIIGALRI
jgi:hypothetical protein